MKVWHLGAKCRTRTEREGEGDIIHLYHGTARPRHEIRGMMKHFESRVI